MKNEIELIVNTNETGHSTFLVENIEKSDEILIAVAFLKVSGLNEILDSLTIAIKKGALIKIIAGQNFAQTEPKALRTLFDLFKNTNSEIRLADYNGVETFHPKIFLFKQENLAKILVGSANLTSGGLVNNYECSLALDCNANDTTWTKTITYFENELIPNSKKLNLVLISRYERYFNEVKPLRDKLNVKPKWLLKAEEFDYNKLSKHLENYKEIYWERDFKYRSSCYLEAKKILNKMAKTDSIDKREFKNLLDELVGGKKTNHYAYWMSGGLSRGKNGKNGGKGIYDCHKEFKALVKYVKENQKLAISELFEGGKSLLAKVKGAGVNYLTEILMTYDPDRFATLNKRPLSVLRDEAGVGFKASSVSFNGEDYEQYCNLMSEIGSKLELNNMIGVDAYFSEIYGKIHKEK
jgi:HKD family nuclease